MLYITPRFTSLTLLTYRMMIRPVLMYAAEAWTCRRSEKELPGADPEGVSRVSGHLPVA